MLVVGGWRLVAGGRQLAAAAAAVLLLAACGGVAAPASSGPAPPASAAAPPSGGAVAESLETVKAAAAKEGKLLWYDTITQEQGDKIIKQFQQAYPAIKDARFLEVTSGNRVARITQESRAGGPTTDVDFENAATTAGYYKDGFVIDVDWKGLGIQGPPQMTPTSYMVAEIAAFRGSLYNTQKVKEADAPKTYEDLIDPKWTNRMGLWARAAAFTGLWQTWGEDKLVSYIKSLAKLKPRLYDSNFTIAQAIGAGEVDVSYTDYHTTLPTVQKGAPVKWVTIDPVPLDPLYGYVLKYGSNHNAGKLLLSWLASPEGARAYEAVAGRGNPFVQGSETQKLLAGHTLSSVDVNTMLQQAAHFNQLEKQFGDILKGGG
ncbi:MAG TPA: ABC transporter substrate-binding protein [Chloroflexota bacterium]|jgi:iron(III) transport system substrate-binding protein